MKKRIRKKRHAGEFKQYGNVFIIKTDGNEQTAEDILTKLEPLIENHSLIIAGGGAGRILIPSKKNNKYIPTIAALITTSIALGLTPTDEMMFCVYVKGAKEVPQEALDAIKETFEAGRSDSQCSCSQLPYRRAGDTSHQRDCQ